MSDRPRRVAVTTLADFACRSGDLDAATVAGPSAREGMVAHQRLQSARAGRTEAEVRLSRRYRLDGEVLELSGRLDLLERGRRTLGEIKSTLVPLERVPPSRHALHRAQLMLYGWLFLGEPEAGHEPLRLELLYLNLREAPAAEPAPVAWEATAEALERHAVEALGRWLRWQRGVDRRRRALASSAASLPFPHERFRAGQRRMSVAVYRCLRDGGGLLCEAPTGTGKTMSSLYPSIKALGEGHRRRLLYLTAKVSGRRSALDALERLQAEGLSVSAVMLRSRRDACFCQRVDDPDPDPGPDADPGRGYRCERDADGRCPMTLGFYDRLPAALEELVDGGVASGARIDEIAWQHQLCPHALSARLLPWVDVAVGDYNHVFDPLARLAGSDEPAPRTALLIDEAHNLPERARAMFSASLSRAECRRAARRVAPSHPLVAARIERVDAALLGAARGRPIGEGVLERSPPRLARCVGEAIEAISATFGLAPALPEEGLTLLRALTRFAVIAERLGEEHRVLLDVRDEARRREVIVRLACLDAAAPLARQLRLFGANVAFSATLAPLGFYRDALGLAAETPVLSLPSPFEASRALHCIVPWIDTRYRHREGSLDALVALIRQVSDSRVGNHLVFLPSYAYLRRVHDAFSRLCPARETWCQSAGQDAESRERLLARLDTRGHRVGFAILGGVYGEGVDYAGERLVGVVVVGTGLPGMSLEQELMAGRYRELGLDGFDFTSRYPGFTRVRQSVGRLIRGEEDRGVVVLVDPRFGETFYRRLMPIHWQARWPAGAGELGRFLQRFWSAAPAAAERPPDPLP